MYQDCISIARKAQNADIWGTVTSRIEVVLTQID